MGPLFMNQKVSRLVYVPVFLAGVMILGSGCWVKTGVLLKLSLLVIRASGRSLKLDVLCILDGLMFGYGPVW